MKLWNVFLTLVVVLFFSGLTRVWASEKTLSQETTCSLGEGEQLNCFIPGGYFHGLFETVSKKVREETDFEEFKQDSFPIMLRVHGIPKDIAGWLNLSEDGVGCIYVPNFRGREFTISSKKHGVKISDTEPVGRLTIVKCILSGNAIKPTPAKDWEKTLREYKKNWRPSFLKQGRE